MAIKQRNLGIYKNDDVIVKDGKYGTYVEYGKTKESLKDLYKPTEYITLEDIIPILEKSLNNNGLDKNMIRELSDDLSIRNGKFGAYVFYKTKTMKKPQFLNIKKFKESYLTCEKEVIIKWLEDNYPILKS